MNITFREAEPIKIDKALLKELLRPIWTEIMEEIGEEEIGILADTEHLGKLVEHKPDGTVVRSQVGEFPRRDTGRLVAGLTYDVVDGENGLPEVVINSDREPGYGDPDNVPKILEDDLDRTILTGRTAEGKEYHEEILARVKAKFLARFGGGE